MKSVSEIVQAFGGPTAFGRIFEIPYNSVQTFRRRNQIPADRDVDLVREAKRMGITLSYEHLAKIRHGKK